MKTNSSRPQRNWPVRAHSLAALLFAAGALAQTPVHLEVASIKPSAPVEGKLTVTFGLVPGGRLEAKGVSTRMLLAIAFDAKENEILGGPGWLDSDRYDLSVIPEAPTAPPAILRTLLAERFALATHFESKEASVYALYASKSGLRLKESASDSVGTRVMRNGQLQFDHAPVRLLADGLSRVLGRTVIDKTGLMGLYDFHLEWSPDESSSLRLPGIPPPDSATVQAVEIKGPTIFSALQEQLGLRLETEKSQIRTVVIDHIDRPSPN